MIKKGESYPPSSKESKNYPYIECTEKFIFNLMSKLGYREACASCYPMTRYKIFPIIYSKKEELDEDNFIIHITEDKEEKCSLTWIEKNI